MLSALCRFLDVDWTIVHTHAWLRDKWRWIWKKAAKKEGFCLLLMQISSSKPQALKLRFAAVFEAHLFHQSLMFLRPWTALNLLFAMYFLYYWAFTLLPQRNGESRDFRSGKISSFLLSPILLRLCVSLFFLSQTFSHFLLPSSPLRNRFLCLGGKNDGT